MAFTLTSKPRQHRIEYSDGVTLIFREFKGEERDKYSLELSKILGTKKQEERYAMLKRQVAGALLDGWEGVVDEVGDPIECNDGNKKLFLEDKESRKYWHFHIVNYINPQPVNGEKPDLVEGGEDPNFTGTK